MAVEGSSHLVARISPSWFQLQVHCVCHFFLATKIEVFFLQEQHIIFYQVLGIHIDSPCCPFCRLAPESAEHLFVHCIVIRAVWMDFGSWGRLQFSGSSIDEVFSWCCQANLEGRNKTLFSSLCIAMLWIIWKRRNSIMFRQCFKYRFFS